jgi:hypothetical protein
MSFANTRRKIFSLVAIAVMTVAFTPIGSKTVAAEGANQVVFSGIGVARDGFQSAFGFWVWCTIDGNGPYADNHVCKGAVYLYRAGHTVGVNGYIVEEADGTYTMHVFPNHPDKRPDFVEAFLHNVSPDIQHGPNNVVEFDVFTDRGFSSGSTSTAVVNITGPGD